MKTNQSLSGLVFCCLLALCGCKQQPKADGFVINGTLSGQSEGALVMLQANSTSSTDILDSAVVSGGKFVLQGKVDVPTRSMLIIDLNGSGVEEPDYSKIMGSELYVENAAMTYEADVNTLPTFAGDSGRQGKPVITGGTEQTLFAAYEKSILSVQEELMRLQFDMLDASAGPVDDVVATVKREADLQQQLNDATCGFIRQHPASAVSLDLLSASLTDTPSPYTAERIDEMLSWVEPSLQGTPQLETLKEQAAKAKRIAVGQPFIDAEFLTTDGKKVKLSSLLSKDGYTMLEFWASWCAPCRGEIPHLVKVHSQYKDFTMISVSVDEKEENWKKALSEEEGMTWTQLRNPDGFGGVVYDGYGITGIPACIVFDSEGRFFKTNMRGIYLDAFLQEVYGDR